MPSQDDSTAEPPPRSLRVSIRSRLRPIPLRDILHWIDQEAASLSDQSGRIAPPDPRLLLTDWHDPDTGAPFGRPDGDMIACVVDEARTRPERQPPAMVGFERLAAAVTGTIALTGNISGKPEGDGAHYLMLRLWTGRTNNLSIDRIIADAGPGERALEAQDYHSHVPQELRKVRLGQGGRPSKFMHGREEAVQAALALHDHHRRKRVPALIERPDLERRLRHLLTLMDLRHGLTPGP